MDFNGYIDTFIHFTLKSLTLLIKMKEKKKKKNSHLNLFFLHNVFLRKVNLFFLYAINILIDIIIKNNLHGIYFLKLL